MSRVPFYANDESNMRCMVAVYQSIVDYFLHKKLSRSEADKLVGFKHGRAAWSLEALTKLTRLGFDIKMIEAFDYRQYFESGEEYLSHYFPPDQLQWVLSHTNLLDIKPYIVEFLDTVHWVKKSPDLNDIDAMLSEKRLVIVTLNGRALHGLDGYSTHAVLITGRGNDEYILHDPGLPPVPDSHILRNHLWEAMGGADNTVEVTGFKLRKGIGDRLDKFVVMQKPRLSRAYAIELIKDHRVLVNGEPSKPGYKVRYDDSVSIDFNEDELDALPKLQLPIIYEDKDTVVINKPAGILVHGKGSIHNEASVASWLRDTFGASIDGDRGGIVHRLDRPTSGVLICAKSAQTLNYLQKQFADRSVQKTYIAVIIGRPPHKHAVINMPIVRDPRRPQMFRAGLNGKESRTEYTVLAQSKKYSLIRLKPTTGRTHQLRVHLARIGHPIVGDYLYGGEVSSRLFLHAQSLEILLPDNTRRVFSADLPPVFKEIMANDAAAA